MTDVRPATPADHPVLADSLASAFAHDPLFSWISNAEPGEAVEAKLRIVFGAMMKVELARDDHLVFAGDEGIGVAVWKRPNEWKMPFREMFRALPAMFRGFGMRTARMIGALSAIEKVHPTEEHYFLEALGTSQTMQSRGVGSAVIRHMLDRCDAEGLPAYLESSNPQNIPFYARHGFEVTSEIDVGKGAPTVTAMWRTPR